MSNRRPLGLGGRLRAAASIIAMGAAPGRYGPLVSSAEWSRSLDPPRDDPYVDPNTALAVSGVWACCSLLADTVPQCSAGVFKKEGDQRTPQPDHPVSQLFSGSVNDAMGRRGLIKTVEFARQLRGNGYAEIERDNSGKPVGLWPLNASTHPKREDGRLVYQTSAGGETIKLPATDVIHIRGLSHDGVLGISPVAESRRAIGLAIRAEQFGTDFFANEAKSGGVLQHPGKLSEQAKKNIGDSFEDQSRRGFGRKESNRIRVLEEGIKFTPTTIAPEEAQFLGSRVFQIEEIARWYRVPLILIQSVEKTTSWGSGVEQLMIGFVAWTVAPLAQSWEEELTLKLLTPEERAAGLYIRLDLRGLLRGDMAARSAYYASAITHGYMTPNEVRAREELDPLPDGDAPVSSRSPASREDGT